MKLNQINNKVMIIIYLLIENKIQVVLKKVLLSKNKRRKKINYQILVFKIIILNKIKLVRNKIFLIINIIEKIQYQIKEKKHLFN